VKKSANNYESWKNALNLGPKEKQQQQQEKTKTSAPTQHLMRCKLKSNLTAMLKHTAQ
jgi:hypothetical protein